MRVFWLRLHRAGPPTGRRCPRDLAGHLLIVRAPRAARLPKRLRMSPHNDTVVLMIPSTVDIGASWPVLPPGVHKATLDEVKAAFAGDAHRERLFDGLVRGCDALRLAGCTALFLDGSYVTDKPDPGDFDACWDPHGVDASTLDPVLLDFDDARKNQKQKYGGEFFPSPALADGTRTFVEFFQVEKETGMQKGVILIRLDS